MSTGLAPSLLLDLAASHIAEQHRNARARSQTATIRRPRTARRFAARAR